MKNAFQIVLNMGIRYFVFRSWYEFKKRTGILKLFFPKKYNIKSAYTLNQWRKDAKPFFFNSNEDLEGFELSPEGKLKLKQNTELIHSGRLKFFSATVYDLGLNYDWITNPETKYKYPLVHWTKIPDFDPEKGDIKYVWEKSRFSFLLTLIRYDQHFKVNQGEFIFTQILDWIDKNPLNQGPNYVCSQEISLRCMNWIFALYYYKNDNNLVQEKFEKILYSIYGQIKHVENNVNFSRIAVRNNHAITETLFLYTCGLLFPFFKEAKIWKLKGKKFFEKEVNYQIYDDGTFLQYSMNYQRVAVQLFSWALFLNEKYEDKFSKSVLDKIRKSGEFLYQCQDEKTGFLPNYGANDGALFFPLNASDFRNYSGQINALNYYFNKNSLYQKNDLDEDIFWFTGNVNVEKIKIERENRSFENGGYFTMRGSNYYSFIRCGNHKNRPSQADNLHFDIWYDGINILRDAGSYKYNCSDEEMNYFFGSQSHNVVTVGNQNQMKKGSRFLWFNWSQLVYTKRPMERNFYKFEGRIKAFQYLGNIEHKRIVKQHFTEPLWEIEDTIFGTDSTCQQIWNISKEFEDLGFKMECYDVYDNKIIPTYKTSWYSSYYGMKEEAKQIVFESDFRYFRTVISRG